MPIVLLTGSTGKLGRYVLKSFQDSLHPTRSEFDVTNRDQVFEYIKAHNPDIIIHLAAVVPIRKCEEDKASAWNTNVLGTKNLLESCLNYSKNCYFVYMSSPCVFSGQDGPYDENSIPYPRNFYGLTKVIAENMVLSSFLSKKLVIRSNFVPKERWPYPKAFTDRFSKYLFADDLAKAIKEVVDAGVTGILHITGDRRMSMFDLAKMTTPDVLPMTMSEYNGPHLTVDMTLETVHPEWRKFKISPPDNK
jgi:dTDP-4-dehydrorhamnose reductase